MDGFFDEFPEFWAPDDVLRKRLNARYCAIIDWNAAALRGARILDIASNNGRWSFAALAAGAARVISIEARVPFAELASENLRAYGIAGDQHEMVVADVYDYLPKLQPGTIDVIFCLGFLYHTLRFDELFYQFCRLKPVRLIIDTKVINVPGPLIELRHDVVDNPMNSIDEHHLERKRVVVGYPSVTALEKMLKSFGFSDIELFDWPRLLSGNPEEHSINQYRLYARGDRVTLRTCLECCAHPER